MKRNEYLVPISREHHFTLLFCWKIRTGVRTSVTCRRIRDYLAYFWDNVLQPHFKEEEQNLFLNHKDTLVLKALAEHKELTEQVMQLLPQDECDYKELLRFADMVDQHTRYEERVLFPHLEKTLSVIELQSIGKHMAASGTDLKDEYADQFWLQGHLNKPDA